MLDDVSERGRSAGSHDTLRDEAREGSPGPAPSARGDAPPPAQAPSRHSGTLKKGFGLAMLLAALSAGAWYGHGWWTDGRFLVSTDDAYIASDMAIVTPKITGYVASVPVVENQVVKANDPLVEIDPLDYRLQLDAANARIETQRLAVASIEAQRAAAVQQVAQARADRQSASSVVDQAQLDRERAEALSQSGAGARAPLDAARAAEAQARAKLAGADAAIGAAEASVTVLEAQAKQAQALIKELELSRDMAARDLSFTTLRAPYDGVVGNLSVQTGDLVSPSRQLAAVVPLNASYINANFKETQLHEIAVGETVRIEADAIPGLEVSGTVVSLSPASGSVFSLLPPENATGNFTKIVQRVPVRIAIDAPADIATQLRPGLSVTVAVDTRTAPAAGGIDLSAARRP
ncbi:HlyD family secretion protein [Aureimonas populi]|uniref:HlyD family secretion protein n=1 Tax=Aureimonas populi TaxID=1701758 RepID=A0ABW5CJR5_9HYPH|nr:HlyD family secretion protein [Aureimonas populi]